MTLQDSAPEYLEQCRRAMAAEQAQSLAETDRWSHVDRQQVHADWDRLYKELAPLIDHSPPSSPDIQDLIQRHYAIASRFYPPSDKAYIGMALFYRDNPDMKAFHDAYHPRMVDFLGEAIFIYAQRHL